MVMVKSTNQVSTVRPRGGYVAMTAVLAMFTTWVSSANADEAATTGSAAESVPGWTVLPLGRIAIGAAVPLTGSSTLSAAADVTVGMRVLAPMRLPRVGLVGEAGYSYAGELAQPTHLFSAGVGPGVTTGFVGVSWMPRFLVGTSLGEDAIGVRNGWVVDWVGLATAEIAHEYVRTETQRRHDLRVTFSFDLGLAIFAFGKSQPPRPR